MSDFSVHLTSRVALVTNAGTETGRAIALTLAQAGAAVCVHDVNPDRADQVVDAIEIHGERAMAWVGDISNRFQVAAMIEALRDGFDGLDMLVNVANTRKHAPVLTMDEYDWRRVLELNLTGTFFCTQLAGRVMADAGGGAIVNVGCTTDHAQIQTGSVAYATSQAGLIGLTRAAARDLAEHGVRINVVCSGNVTPKSNIIESMKPAPDRTGTPDQIASIVLFLCSTGASSITGQTFVVDGNETVI